ncbi:hypothetical protein RB195_010132 [Necator americanus]|uniref:Uncharacterized protein n=2 Tax=Necator americanus TaxID=51031 RepID=A0ABR1CYF4_NECAM|nr:hypothetical protein NECAME_02497 [Necator americanus]ETN80018.1 hypothetical protein NECAME_02497 [Necator americanus]
MVFRFIRTLLNNEKVIQQLSESPPIRLLARAIVRGGKSVEDKIQKLNMTSRIEAFLKMYQEEYKKALKK